MSRTCLCRILTANVIEARYDVERFSLDWTKVKIGEVVHVIDTGHFYLIKDIEELDNENGYLPLDSGPAGSVTSVGITMPVGFNVSNSPIINSGTINITTSLNGIIKGTGSGFATAVSGTDFELPLTFSGGVTRVVNNITVDTALPLARISSLSTNGFIKASGGNGTLTVDTNTYLTASTGVTSISGTSNEISASSATGSVTLSLPNALTFTGKTITGGTFTGGTFGGNASTATALQTGRAINGVNFNGTADITVTAAAGTLTGATLNSTVTASSLTSLGLITSLAASAAQINALTAGQGVISQAVGDSKITILDGDTSGLSGKGSVTFVDSATGYGGEISHYGPLGSGGNTAPAGGLSINAQSSLTISVGGVRSAQFSGLGMNGTLNNCIQSTAAACTTDFPKTNTTLSDVTGLSVNVVAGCTYTFLIKFSAGNTVTGGIKWGLGGTATFTSFRGRFTTDQYDIGSVAHLLVTSGSTSGLILSAGGSGRADIDASGILTCSTSGTVTIQFAQNNTSGTTTLYSGGFIQMVRVS